MAIPFSDNLSISGKYPDITRQEYATLADLKAVKKNRMPEMYFGYCLEDHNWYAFNKQNSEDPVTGYWRVFASGSSAQVTEMPEPVESLLGAIVQYVGSATVDYTTGWFYICTATSETETLQVETIAKLKELIEASNAVATVRFEDDSTEALAVYESNGFSYYIFEDNVFGGIVVNDEIIHSDSTQLTTDEQVAERNITYDVTTTTYSWENQTVSPSGGEPESIPGADIDALFD